MNANAMGLTSNVERILSTIANVQADTTLISTTLQAWQRPVMSNLGYTWEDTSSLGQSVLLLDAIGRNISLPLMFVSSPNVRAIKEI
jgi:spore coat protein CotF